MAERFINIVKKTETITTKECPVVIVAYALLEDTIKKKKIMQVKLQNIGDKTVSECRIKAAEGDNPDILTFTFEDLNFNEDDIFGSKQPIDAPNETGETVKPYVDYVKFSDGSEWQGDGEYTVIPELKELFADDEQLATQYRAEIGEDSKYVPNLENGFFRCTCGALSVGDTCRKCGRTFEDESEILFDLDGLRERAVEREKQLEEEKKKAEEKAQKEAEALLKRKKQKKKRTLIIALACVVVLIGAGVFSYFQFIKPANEYQKAEALVSEGKYEDANTIFVDLGDYKEAATYATYCQGNMNMAAGNYQEAEDNFNSIPDFKDSSDRATEAKYNRGLALLEAGELDKAYAIFVDLDNYKESATNRQEINYRKATKLLEAAKYDDAVTAFETLGDYKDSATLLKETLYRKAVKEAKSDSSFTHLFTAFNLFNQLSNYSDAPVKAQETLVALVNLHLSKQYQKSYFPTGLNQSQQLTAYNTVVAYINDNIERSFDEWRDCSIADHSYARNVYDVLNTFPNGYEERNQLLNIFKVVKDYDYSSSGFYSVYPDNKSAFNAVWDTALRENIMNDNWILVGFLMGHWTTYDGRYYFDVEEDGYSSFNLPWVDATGREFYHIEDYIYYWGSNDNDKLVKVFDFTMTSPNEIDVYCFKDGYTYTLYRH